MLDVTRFRGDVHAEAKLRPSDGGSCALRQGGRWFGGAMGKGGYLGGSTIIGPWSSDWFGNRDRPSTTTREKKKTGRTSSATSPRAPKPKKAKKLSGVVTKQQRHAEATAAKREKRQQQAKQRAKAAELSALRQARAKEEAAEKKAKAAVAAKARRQSAVVASRIIPRVPQQGEVAVFTQRKRTRVPEVEVHTTSGRRIKIETSVASRAKGPRPGASSSKP